MVIEREGLGWKNTINLMDLKYADDAVLIGKIPQGHKACLIE